MKKKLELLIPVFGTLLFITLYIIASFLYPGGSQVNKNSPGFSWKDNYWCNLLNENAINGQHNPARPVALSGMFILCLTLSFFWYIFPGHINIGRSGKFIIRFSGILAMAIALFLFTGLHDVITNVASFFGLIAVAGTFVSLYKNKWYPLFLFGIFNLFLVGLNNYVYYTKGLIIYLPVIQKISFASFLIWICCIDINLYIREYTPAKNPTTRILKNSIHKN